MDKREYSKEVEEELVRESFIEISYSWTDKVENPDVEDDGVVGDEADKYRSELISISYSESSDLKFSPVALGKRCG